MNDNPLISIVIPYYKGKQFIEQAVKSVMNQPYKNIEILLINDGSPDDGDEVCRKLETKHSQIVYYYKLKEAKLIVHYIAEDTKEKLCDDLIEEVTYQDTYSTDSCTSLTNINYTYKNVVTNDTNSEQRGMRTLGNILQDVVEVTYYYELKPGQIIVYFFEVGTRDRVADDIVVNGLASKEYISQPKEIEGYTLVSKPESNVHIFEEDTQEVVYEYERNTKSI